MPDASPILNGAAFKPYVNSPGAPGLDFETWEPTNARVSLNPGAPPNLGAPSNWLLRQQKTIGWEATTARTGTDMVAPSYVFSRKRKNIGWEAIFLVIFAFLIAHLPAQEAPTTTLHVDVHLVNVFVNVTDANGAIVGGLNRDDFALTEDGRPQQIAVFERQSAVPLNITLAIDTSGSVRKDMTPEATAAHRFARALLRPQDQMSVLQFATNVTELVPFTNKINQIDHGLGRLRGDWATALYDAVWLGSQGLGKKQGRKVLILVSDGDDTAKSTTYDQAVEQALRNEVMIYSLIDVPIAADAGRDVGGEHAMIALSEQTGGKYFYIGEGGLDKAFSQVSDDLRTQYLLGYYPRKQEPGISFHRIEVTVPRAADGAFQISHRTGYYSDSPAKSK